MAHERLLVEFSVASEPGNERFAMAHVVDAVRGLRISPARVERLKTAVAEATMNAIEHGNRNRPDLQVHVRVSASAECVWVRITDQGGGAPATEHVEEPDLSAKLAGYQPTRGWGLFLIQNMVDSARTTSDTLNSTTELMLRLDGEG